MSLKEIHVATDRAKTTIASCLLRCWKDGYVLRSRNVIREPEKTFKGRRGYVRNLRSYYRYVIAPQDVPALQVDGMEIIIDPMNKMISRALDSRSRVFLTRDWHPVEPESFKENGGPFPTHCVERTRGARIHSDLDQFHEAIIVLYKGFYPHLQGFSAFEYTGLEKIL